MLSGSSRQERWFREAFCPICLLPQTSLVAPMLLLEGLDFTGRKFRKLVEIAPGKGQCASSPINKPFISNLRGMSPADAEVKRISSMKVPLEFLS